MMTSHGSELKPPVGEGDHVQGPASAPVTLVEYGDYECPYCGAAYPIVKEIQQRLGDRLRFVFRNFPITTAHPHAEHAAEAAEAAGAQGKFWEMHDYLYEHQRALMDRKLDEYAAAVGLDVERWVADMETQAFAERVRADFMSGVRSGVNGTPTFYINGVRHNGSFDLESLMAAIEAAMPAAPSASPSQERASSTA
jgi:protein-disulfide isomerase